MARARVPFNRLVTVWCPQWSAAATGIPADEPIAVMRAHRVIAASPPAIQAGVLVGLRRREAQARCPGVQLVDHDPERDARRFEPVARAVGTLVPRLEITEPGWLTFAARGPSRYVGGDEALAVRIAHLVAIGLGEPADELSTGEFSAGRPPAGEFSVGGPPAGAPPIEAPFAGAPFAGAPGLKSRAVSKSERVTAFPVLHLGLGIADGRFASGVAARQSAAAHKPVIVPSGRAETARYLARFPLRVLHDVAGVPLDLLDLCARLGLQRLGQLAGVPVGDVLARFGHPGVFAHRLAGGHDPRSPGANEPPADLTVIRHFDDPVIQTQPLVFVGRQMAEELHEELFRRGLVAVRLAIEAETEYQERSERVWYRPEGLNVAGMVDRVRWQLDGWVRQPGGLTGGVVVLRLIPVETRADAGRQLGFWGGQSEADAWALRATTRLLGLLGPDEVMVPEARGGRDPGDAFTLVSAALIDIGERSAAVATPLGVGPPGSGSPRVDQPGSGRPGVGSPGVCSGSAARVPESVLTARAVPSPRPRRLPTPPSARAAPPSWPGRLPTPSPATVLPEPQPCVVLDASGAPVSVTGRGFVTAAPARLDLDGRSCGVTAWAGPWLVEERWWEPGGGRRRARFQLVTADGNALLASVERGTWTIEAIWT